MKEWHDKLELLDALAEARRQARDTVPRSGGNDALEAAMFLAMFLALDKFMGEDDQPETTDEPGTDLVPAAPALPAPETVTEDIPEPEPEPEPEEEPEEEDDEPRGRKRGRH